MQDRRGVSLPAVRRRVVDHWDAELFAAEVMRALGFGDAKVTRASADGGIDVVAGDGIAQVKFQRSPVGRPALQQLKGAADGQLCLFFARPGYSLHAYQWGVDAAIAMFEFTARGDVRSVGPRAAEIVRRSATPGEPKGRRMSEGWWLSDQDRFKAVAHNRELVSRPLLSPAEQQAAALAKDPTIRRAGESEEQWLDRRRRTAKSQASEIRVEVAALRQLMAPNRHQSRVLRKVVPLLPKLDAAEARLSTKPSKSTLTGLEKIVGQLRKTLRPD